MTNNQLALILAGLSVVLAAIPLGLTALAAITIFLLGLLITELARRGP
jgi:hypothetical protein